ncbi:hypothetical protein D3C72_2507140 [compost metagenome]
MGQHRMECAVGQIVHPGGWGVMPEKLHFLLVVEEAEGLLQGLVGWLFQGIAPFLRYWDRGAAG